MARATETAERIAKLEANVENLRLTNADLKADLRQTVKEFREALEKHEGHHQTSANTKWKIISAVLAVVAIASPIVTLVVERAVD